MLAKIVQAISAAWSGWRRRRPDGRTRRHNDPPRPARGGAPLIIGLAALALLAAGAEPCGAEDSLVSGEILAVDAVSHVLTLRLAGGEKVDLEVAAQVGITLNGRSVAANALRPVSPGSFMDARVTLGAEGRVLNIEAQYKVIEGTVVQLAPSDNILELSLVEERSSSVVGPVRTYKLARQVEVTKGYATAGVESIKPGQPVLALLNMLGEVKKIEMPPA